MEAMKFQGWIEHIFPAGQFGQDIVVRDYKDAIEKPQYPNILKFTASTKVMPSLSGLVEGDKIEVKFYLNGKSGTGKNGYYAIIRLNIAKDGGIKVIETVPRDDKDTTVKQEESDELPF